MALHASSTGVESDGSLPLTILSEGHAAGAIIPMTIVGLVKIEKVAGTGMITLRDFVVQYHYERADVQGNVAVQKSLSPPEPVQSSTREIAWNAAISVSEPMSSIGVPGGPFVLEL